MLATTNLDQNEPKHPWAILELFALNMLEFSRIFFREGFSSKRESAKDKGRNNKPFLEEFLAFLPLFSFHKYYQSKKKVYNCEGLERLASSLEVVIPCDIYLWLNTEGTEYN